MDISGMVFICAMFVLSIALLAFCCVKSCTSEEKYVRNPGNISINVPTLTTNCTANETPSVFPSTIAKLISQSSPLEVDNNKKKEKNSPCPKFLLNLLSKPKGESIEDKNQPKPHKPRFVINETKYAPPKTAFHVTGARSLVLTAGFIVDATLCATPKVIDSTPPPISPKLGLVLDSKQFVAPKLDCSVNATEPVASEAGSVAGTECPSPNQAFIEITSSKSGLVLDSNQSAAEKSDFAVDESQCVLPPKSGFVIDNSSITQCVLSKQALDGSRAQYVCPKPGFALDKNQSVAPKLDCVVVVGTQCARAEPVAPKLGLIINEAQSIAPKPDFIVDGSQTAPPKMESVADGLQSAIYTAFISPNETKPPRIAEAVSMDNVILRYPTRRRRTPSPNPEVYKTSYSPRTSTFFAENAGPLSGIGLSSENLTRSSKPRPPSYEEAMLEYQFPAVVNSGDGQFSEHKIDR